MAGTFQSDTGGTLIPLLSYSGITLVIRFQGSLAITLADREYSVTHENMETETIGLRFHETAPSVRVKAIDASRIEFLKASMYKL